MSRRLSKNAADRSGSERAIEADRDQRAGGEAKGVEVFDLTVKVKRGDEEPSSEAAAESGEHGLGDDQPPPMWTAVPFSQVALAVRAG